MTKLVTFPPYVLVALLCTYFAQLQVEKTKLHLCQSNPENQYCTDLILLAVGSLYKLMLRAISVRGILKSICSKPRLNPVEGFYRWRTLQRIAG